MQKLHRFEGEKVTIDGVVGTIVSLCHSDCHYRFVWREGQNIGERVISGPRLRPAPDDSPHGERKFTFVQSEITLFRRMRTYTPESKKDSGTFVCNNVRIQEVAFDYYDRMLRRSKVVNELRKPYQYW